MNRKIGTAPVNPLPLQPKLSPALGLSGALLLLSGLVYTFIGIKNKWFVVTSRLGNLLTHLRLYVSFSSAYLASLAVTVRCLRVGRG